MEQTPENQQLVQGQQMESTEVNFRAKFLKVAKDSFWQRLLLFSILFPIGIISFVYSWAASIAGMVNLSGDVGNRLIYTVTSLVSLVLARPAIFFAGSVNDSVSKFTDVNYIDSPLIFFTIIALYIFLLASVIVMVLWKVFSRIPKWLCITVVIILWVSMSWLSYDWYKKGYLKGIIGENPFLAQVYTKEDDEWWDNEIEKARQAFATWPEETIRDVLIYEDIAGFSPNQVVYNSVYEISSEFQLNYQTLLNGEIIGNVGVKVETYGSKAYLYQYMGDTIISDSIPFVELEDGNKIKALGTSRENWIGYNILWVSGRRLVTLSGGYTPNSGLEDEFDQLVSAYLDKYPSDLEPGESEYIIRSQDPARKGTLLFEDTSDNLSFELPEGTIAFKYINSQGNFIAADKSDNNFSITSDPQQVLCCEGPLLSKQLLSESKIDEFINNLPWLSEITHKSLISDKAQKVYYLEAHSTIMSPYKAIFAGTNSGNDPVQSILLNMPNKILESIFQEYYNLYSNR